MRKNLVKELWAKGKCATCGWLSIGNSYSAEIVGMSGVDCASVDLQHGMTDIPDMIPMLQAISATPAVPFVRLPGNLPATAMKVLDAGAYGLICPLVNSVVEAEQFVASSMYPPKGGRSFGPSRGLLYGGSDYPAHANDTIVRLAMIETREGLDEVEGICAIDGLDGIFIGPNDLGLNLGKGTSTDPTDSEVCEAIDHCLAVAKKAGKQAGLFCPSGAVARRRADEGFGFVVLNSEANLLKGALASQLGDFRK